MDPAVKQPEAPQTSGITLDRAPMNQVLTVVNVTCDQMLARRLATLGLRSGSSISVVGNTTGRGRVVSADGARIALDRTVMRQMEVEVA
ncbi:MAG: FeoA family protein [Propionibacteriaceae bacterium]